MKEFAKWCAKHQVAELPAEPADVASFVKDSAAQGATKVFILLGQISRAHCVLGVKDPTRSPAVDAAVNAIGTIEAPRSWAREMHGRFYSLPRDIQAYILQRQIETEAALRIAQNEAAERKRELIA